MRDAIKFARPASSWRDYLKIARPDHWVKNIFVLPGCALAITLSGRISPATPLLIIHSLIVTCLIASANYTINEFLDAKFDRFHPIKKDRPGAQGHLWAPLVVVQWALLSAVGLALAAEASWPMFAAAAFLLFMGILYNVEPIRTKDRAYLDVLSESINNPIRLTIGWVVILPGQLPPSSLLICYWMGGAFLMAMKRYSEYRRIGSPEIAGSYRRSFRVYTERTLLLSSFFYALTASLLLGVFLIKYRIEYLLTVPLFALLFTQYFSLSMEADSAAQAPEKLYKEKSLVIVVFALVASVAILTFIDIPALAILMEPVRYW